MKMARRICFLIGALFAWTLNIGTALADLIEDPTEDLQAPMPQAQQKTGGQVKSPNLLHDDAAAASKSSGTKPRPAQTEPMQPAHLPGSETKATERKQPDKGERNRNPSAPIKFGSTDLSGERDGGVIVLEKDVVVTQDDLRITADKATIMIDRLTNEVIEVIAVGNVHFNRKDPDTGRPVTAESREAVFNNSTRTVVLKGDPKMIRGTDVVKGRQIIYDLNTGWVKATRVEGVVQPKKAQDTKKAPAKSTDGKSVDDKATSEPSSTTESGEL